MFTKTLIASFAVAGVLTGASVLSANVASAAPNWCGHDGQPPCPDKFQGGKPPGQGGQGGQQGGQGGGAQQQGGNNNPPPGMPKPPKPPGNGGNNGGVDLNITIGNGGYGGGGGYGNPGWHPHKPGYGGGGYGNNYPPPPYYGGGYGGQFVTCGMAKQIVRQSGFWNVNTQSCGGPFYSFTGMKRGRPFEIDVSRRGKIINVDRAY